jgi:hypothetical protein
MSAETFRGRSRLAWVVWIIFGLSTALMIFALGRELLKHDPTDSFFKLANDILWGLLPVVLTGLSALIISRQPRNAIGWLLMIPPLALVLQAPFEPYLTDWLTSSPTASLPLLIFLWFSNWSWILLIIPLLLIPLLFPTGRPPSPRWRWVFYYAVVLFAAFLVIATFGKEISDIGGTVSFPNPIGFIPISVLNGLILPWLIGLSILAVLCAVSLFVRYRRASLVEREQIKWLLYAFAVFVVIYVPSLILNSQMSARISEIWEIFFVLSILTIPIAIAIAILRYRLWDIDLIIRRTLVYGGLTLTLAAVYFGSVVLLQALFQRFAGEQSTVAIVLSTLLIAALFNPLRRRIQRDIDQRFYRKKYDAQRTLEAFTASLRDQVELEQLASQLVVVVQETMQPEHVSLWLQKPSHKTAPDFTLQRVKED